MLKTDKLILQKLHRSSFYHIIRPKICKVWKSVWPLMLVLSLRLASGSCGSFDLNDIQQLTCFLKLVFPVLKLTFYHAAWEVALNLVFYKVWPHEFMNLPGYHTLQRLYSWFVAVFIQVSNFYVGKWLFFKSEGLQQKPDKCRWIVLLSAITRAKASIQLQRKRVYQISTAVQHISITLVDQNDTNLLSYSLCGQKLE